MQAFQAHGHGLHGRVPGGRQRPAEPHRRRRPHAQRWRIDGDDDGTWKSSVATRARDNRPDESGANGRFRWAFQGWWLGWLDDNPDCGGVNPRRADVCTALAGCQDGCTAMADKITRRVVGDTIATILGSLVQPRIPAPRRRGRVMAVVVRTRGKSRRVIVLGRVRIDADQLSNDERNRSGGRNQPPCSPHVFATVHQQQSSTYDPCWRKATSRPASPTCFEHHQIGTATWRATSRSFRAAIALGKVKRLLPCRKVGLTLLSKGSG